MPAKSLYATMKPLPGQETFVKNAISEMATHVRKEPGNVRFEVYHLDSGVIYVEETYKDEAAFQAHMGYAHGKKFNSSIVDKVEGGASDVVFLHPINTTL